MGFQLISRARSAFIPSGATAAVIDSCHLPAPKKTLTRARTAGTVQSVVFVSRQLKQAVHQSLFQLPRRLHRKRGTHLSDDGMSPAELSRAEDRCGMTNTIVQWL